MGNDPAATSQMQADAETLSYEEIEAHRKNFPLRRNLIRYLALHLGKRIPYKVMCKGHNAPAEFIDHILYGDGDVLALACRSGGKTTQLGIASGMCVYPFENRPDGIPIRELGGSSDQGERVYEEFRDFLAAGYGDQVHGEVFKRKTSFRGGGRIEMLMQSEKSVRGPHVPRLFLDEIDEFDHGVFNAALSIPQSHNGVASMVVMASTRHRPFGLMSEQFEDFEGRRLIWCVFEIMEACSDKSACRSCNLISYCPGWEKRRGGVGYYTLLDAQRQRTRIKDDDVYFSEVLCREPRSEGQIYQGLQERFHFQPLRLDRSVPLTRSFDYGTDHPTVLGYWQIVKVEGREQARQVDEVRWRGKAPSTMVKDMLNYERVQRYDSIEDTLVPKDAAGFRAQLEDAGVETSIPDQAVEDGIGTVRNLIVPDPNDVPGIVFNKEKCLRTWQEMNKYHMKNGKVVKIKDDGPDQARYFCHSQPELQVDAMPVIATSDYDMV